MIEWNRTVSNLFSRNDETRFVQRHLLEAVAPAAWLASSGAARWLDLGSGGGLPAIPLTIAGVGSTWTLVESRRTKTLFLRKTLSDMKVGNIEVVLDRAENLVRNSFGASEYNGFTSRATLPLVPTLKIARHFVPAGGSAYLWKGSRREEEMRDESWAADWELDGLLGVGDSGTVVARFRRKA